ncbi:MAG: hypothetical protein KA902_02520 [Arenimonas sp.]|nr:hypothetical protein [Arenimonas sp.]
MIMNHTPKPEIPFTWPSCRYCGSYRTLPINSLKKEHHYSCSDCRKKFVAIGHPKFLDNWRTTKKDEHGNIFYITENSCYRTFFGGGYIILIDILGTGFYIVYGGLHKSQKYAKELVIEFSDHCPRLLSSDIFLSKYAIPKEIIDGRWVKKNGNWINAY